MALNEEELGTIAKQFNHAKVRAEAGIATADTLLALLKSLLTPGRQLRQFIPDGTLNAPGLAFEGDPEAGIYRLGETWHLVSSGDEYVTINALDSAAVRIDPAYTDLAVASGIGALLEVSGSLGVDGSGGAEAHAVNISPAGVETGDAGLSIPVVSSLRVTEPNITEGLAPIDVAASVYVPNAPTEGAENYAIYAASGDVFFGSDVRVDGNFTETMTVESTGPHAFGFSSSVDFIQFRIGGAFTSGGASNNATGLRVATALTGADGDTGAVGLSLMQVGGSGLGGSITTQNNTETVARAASIFVEEPGITVSGADTLQRAASIIIRTAPSEGSTLNAALLIEAGDLILENTGQQLFIGDTANADQATGITINAGTNNDPVLALKRTDVAHGLVSVTETDTCFNVGTLGAQGGVSIAAVAEDDTNQQNVMQYTTYGGEGSSAKTTSAQGLHWMISIEHNGSDSLANVTANGNVFAVSAQVGGVLRTIWILDEDGDYHYDGADGGAFDEFDDVELLRALSYATTRPDQRNVLTLQKEQMYSKKDLCDARLLGAEDDGLVNAAQENRLLRGAILQMAERIEKLEEQLGLAP